MAEKSLAEKCLAADAETSQVALNTLLVALVLGSATFVLVDLWAVLKQLRTESMLWKVNLHLRMLWSPVEKSVSDELAKQREFVIRQFAGYLCPILSLGLVFVFSMNTHAYLSGDPLKIKGFLTESLLFGVLCGRILFGLAKRFRAGQEAMLNLAIAILTALRAFMVPDAIAFLKVITFQHFARLLMAALLMHTPSTVGATTLMLVANTIVYRFVWLADNSGLQSLSPAMFFARELCLSLAIIAASNFVEYFMMKDIRASQASASDAAAAARLLSSQCDAVLRLDEQLRFSDGASKFASLMRCSRDIAGRLFSSFLPQDEVDRFRKHVAHVVDERMRWDTEGSVPDTVPYHTTLLMEDQTPFEVRLFHACLVSVDGAVSHLVAVCQLTPEDVALCDDDDEDVDDAAALQRAMQKRLAKGPVPRSNHSSPSRSAPRGKRPRAAFEIFSPELAIADVTREWRKMWGAVYGLEALASADVIGQLHDALQPWANKAISGKWSLEQAHRGTMQLTVPTTGVAYNVSYTIMLPDPLVAYSVESEEPSYTAILRLEEVSASLESIRE